MLASNIPGRVTPAADPKPSGRAMGRKDSVIGPLTAPVDVAGDPPPIIPPRSFPPAKDPSPLIRAFLGSPVSARLPIPEPIALATRGFARKDPAAPRTPAFASPPPRKLNRRGKAIVFSSLYGAIIAKPRSNGYSCICVTAITTDGADGAKTSSFTAFSRIAVLSPAHFNSM